MKRGMVWLVAGLLFLSGCAAVEKWRGKEETPKSGPETPNVVFHTFPDIPVPKELTLIREKSFIYETPNLKAGVLVLNGNVEVPSLENYFKINMVKNGWRFVNSYKFGDVILNFVKEDRSSNLRMTRDSFTTQVEIWVGPVDRSVTPDRTISPMIPKGNDFK
jgi:hypothetical protein